MDAWLRNGGTRHMDMSLVPFGATSGPSVMTVPVGLGTVRSAYGIQYAQRMAAALLGTLPLMVVFMVVQRRVVPGVTEAGLK